MAQMRSNGLTKIALLVSNFIPIIGSSSCRVKSDFKTGVWCFSVKHTASRNKSEDRLARKRDNLSECSYMSTRGLLFQWASNYTNQTKHVGLGQANIINILLKLSVFLPWYSWQITHLALSNNHSIFTPNIISETNWKALVYSRRRCIGE